MVIPEKTYTDNPFVDNIIYYAKLMAMNCTIKDEEEALNNETKESLEDGDILIACIENTCFYEMFKKIPKEILEKYIPVQSNLDLFVDNPDTLKTHLYHYSHTDRMAIFNDLSELARNVYIDHYNIMTGYLRRDISTETWADDNKDLYDRCVDGTATYEDLFDIMPTYTTRRIVKTYLNNYDSSDIDTLISSLESFNNYVSSRSDPQINEEIRYISEAMRDVFKSHYEIMLERRYVGQSIDKWYTYIDSIDVYRNCKLGLSTFENLYNLFPEDELYDSLKECVGEINVVRYSLTSNLDTLINYFNTISSNRAIEISKLNKNMRDKYLSNYRTYMDFGIYAGCNAGRLNYFQVAKHLPRETKKMILNTKIKEYSNLKIYSENKNMLDSYLATLAYSERIKIKQSINNDMREWYPSHHVEKNNYYRALIGLPPMDENGNVYEDTLIHSYDAKTNSYIEFGDRFIKNLPIDVYPEIHWKQNICDFDSYDIDMLKEEGIIDEYIAACGATYSDPRYRYLKYLTDNKLDIYDCRKARKFDLIGLPTVDDFDAKKRFIDCYENNRSYVLSAVYSDAHKFQSDYYDKFMIIFTIINTIMDMLSDITVMIIDREVFDYRCIKWLFESFGVPYYSEIPLKYLKAMVKNLNLLLKYKASTRNMIDICRLFGFNDTKVFGYYLFRERTIDSTTGEYTLQENNDINYDLDDLWIKDINGPIMDYNNIIYAKLKDHRNYDENKYTKEVTVQDEDGNLITKRILNNDADVYIKDPNNNEFIPLKDATYFTSVKANTNPAQLKFIKVPIDDELAKYKNDPNYIVSYDEITYADEGDTWDGGINHEVLEQQLIDHEFNAVKSKYISVESLTDLTEQAFQVSYFYNMLFDNLYSEETLTVKVPYIKIGHTFKFMDIICYLFALMYYYEGIKDNIMYSPTQILYVKGYNFDEALDQLLDDDKCFTQEEDRNKREDIFDINERIEEDNYDYRKQFEGYGIKAFNLEADIDALDKWLWDFCKMTLDDFIIDDTKTNFDQIITLRQFYSLNNSYYQKDIFKDAVAPTQYNQELKSAYGYILCEKIYFTDFNGYKHSFIVDDGVKMEVINDLDGDIYVMDYNTYIITYDSISHTLYRNYKKNGNTFEIGSPHYYYYDENTNQYKRFFEGEYYLVDSFEKYIFAVDALYQKDDYGNYNLVIDPMYFIQDTNEPDKKRLIFGSYWIKDLETGEWVLDLNYAYFKVTIGNKETVYKPWAEVKAYVNDLPDVDDCFIKHSDGHFIKFSETDYYRVDGENAKMESSRSYYYNEEDLYVEITSEIELKLNELQVAIEDLEPYMEYDTDVDGNFHRYVKVADYINNSAWVYEDTVYVYIKEIDQYIPEHDLLSPNNCYFKLNDNSSYDLVINHIAAYHEYDDSIYCKDNEHILVLDTANDYTRYALQDNGNYLEVDVHNRRYIYNSQEYYVTALLDDETYESTKSMIVVFNKKVTSSYDSGFDIAEYNPEVLDRVWDENDWFYIDERASANEIIGMHGENIWYYRKPGSTLDINDTFEAGPIGSGFIMLSTAYIGNAQLEEGQKYYIAFDIETNFSGKIKIYNTAESAAVDNINERMYEVLKREKQHISQVFIANGEKDPQLRFLIYDFNNFPITPGDYIVVSNIRVVKAKSDNFIAQDIPSYDKLQEIYRTNEAIYKWLIKKMSEESDFHKYGIYKKLYDSLMVSKYNKEAFKIGDNRYAKTYTEFIMNRDAVLYTRLTHFMNLNSDTKHKEIADEIVELTYAIDDCIDVYNYGFLYSYFPAVSANYIQQYITKLIKWFKSWKVHMLGINTVYKLADPNENKVRPLESQEYKNKYDFIKGNVYMHDTIKINPLDAVNPSGEKYTDLYDIDDPTNYPTDYYRPRDRVRIVSRTGDRIEYRDSETNLHLIFNNDGTIAKVDDDNRLKITSPNAGFSTKDENRLNEIIDEDPEQDFAHQFIREINLYSGDYIEWRDLLDE